MDDLVTFLRACLDEDERVAREASETRAFWDHEPPLGWWTPSDANGIDGTGVPVFLGYAGMPTAQVAAHIARHDPARVLAEVAAKRAIMEQLALAADLSFVGSEWPPGDDTELAAWVLANLATVYADRPGYREEWRP